MTATDDTKAAVPPQLESFGPNAEKVMDPVGLEPPDKVAVSEIAPPKVTDPDAWVVIVGAVVTTVTVAMPALFSVFGSPDDDTEAMFS